MKKFVLLTTLTALLTFVILSATKSMYAQQPPSSEGSTSITGIVIRDVDNFQSGDVVKAYFLDTMPVGVIAYEIGQQTFLDYDQGFVMSAMNQTETPFNGAPYGEYIYLAVQNESGTFKLNLLDIKDNYGKPYTLKARGLELVFIDEVEITNEEIELHQVPWILYFNSLCPIISMDKVNIKDPVAGQEIRLPLLVQYKRGYEVELVSGTGKLIKKNSYNYYYVTGGGDIDLLNIQIKVKAIPFAGCVEDQVVKVFTIDVEKTNSQQARYPDLSQTYWSRIYVKYFIDAKVEGNQITVRYLNKEKERRRWADRPLPPLSFEVLSTSNKYGSLKSIEFRKTYEEYPVEVFELPADWQRAQVYVRPIFHDYQWIYKFSK